MTLMLLSFGNFFHWVEFRDGWLPGGADRQTPRPT